LTYSALGIYIEEICDVGVARSDTSPVELGVVPVVEDERRRVNEEEIRNSFVENKSTPTNENFALE
jgi:hypothetical protein